MSFTEKSEEQQDLLGYGVHPSNANKEFLKMTDTNRDTPGTRYAQLANYFSSLMESCILSCRTDTGKQFFAGWLELTEHNIDSRQLTMDENSRLHYKDVLVAGSQRKRGLFNFGRKQTATPAPAVDNEMEEP